MTPQDLRGWQQHTDVGWARVILLVKLIDQVIKVMSLYLVDQHYTIFSAIG